MWKRFALWAIKLLGKAAVAEVAKRVAQKRGEAVRLELEAGKLIAQAAAVKAEAESLATKGISAVFSHDA